MYLLLSLASALQVLHSIKFLLIGVMEPTLRDFQGPSSRFGSTALGLDVSRGNKYPSPAAKAGPAMGALESKEEGSSGVEAHETSAFAGVRSAEISAKAEQMRNLTDTFLLTSLPRLKYCHISSNSIFETQQNNKVCFALQMHLKVDS